MANQVKEVILGTIKASLIAYEVCFRKCKALVKQRFPKVGAGLIDVPLPSEVEVPELEDVPDPTTKEPTQAKDGPTLEAQGLVM